MALKGDLVGTIDTSIKNEVNSMNHRREKKIQYNRSTVGSEGSLLRVGTIVENQRAYSGITCSGPMGPACEEPVTFLALPCESKSLPPYSSEHKLFPSCTPGEDLPWKTL